MIYFSGRDVNGLTKEFFSIGISALQSGRIGNHPLFEGQLDHLLPTCDPFLLNSGYFKVLGKFMAHAAVHVGVGFIGLSRSVVSFLFQKDGNEEEPIIECSIDDISDLEIKTAAQLVSFVILKACFCKWTPCFPLVNFVNEYFRCKDGLYNGTPQMWIRFVKSRELWKKHKFSRHQLLKISTSYFSNT